MQIIYIFKAGGKGRGPEGHSSHIEVGWKPGLTSGNLVVDFDRKGDQCMSPVLLGAVKTKEDVLVSCTMASPPLLNLGS